MPHPHTLDRCCRSRCNMVRPRRTVFATGPPAAGSVVGQTLKGHKSLGGHGPSRAPILRSRTRTAGLQGTRRKGAESYLENTS